MPDTIPMMPYLRSKHLSAESIRGITLTKDGGTGLYTVDRTATPVSILRHTKGGSKNMQNHGVEISPDSTTFDNNVTVGYGHDVSIDVYLVDEGTDLSPLQSLIEQFDYAEITKSRGTGATAETETITFRIAGLSEHDAGKGECLATITGDSCNIESQNPIRRA